MFIHSPIQFLFAKLTLNFFFILSWTWGSSDLAFDLGDVGDRFQKGLLPGLCLSVLDTSRRGLRGCSHLCVLLSEQFGSYQPEAAAKWLPLSCSL